MENCAAEIEARCGTMILSAQLALQLGRRQQRDHQTSEVWETSEVFLYERVSPWTNSPSGC